MTMLEKLRAYLESDEGKEDARKYWEKINHKAQVDKNWINKFNNLQDNDKEIIIEKIITKYKSNQYIDKWYSKGCFPPEPFFYLLYKCAAEYGKCIDDDNEIYVFNGYSFEMINGQGTYINIEKL